MEHIFFTPKNQKVMMTDSTYFQQCRRYQTSVPRQHVDHPIMLLHEFGPNLQNPLRKLHLEHQQLALTMELL